jgi:acetyl esterase/lipase
MTDLSNGGAPGDEACLGGQTSLTGAPLPSHQPTHLDIRATRLTNRPCRYPSLRDNADGYHVTRDDLRWCVRNYLPAGTGPADPRISPARHRDLTGLPAAVLAAAQYDPLRDQGTAYAEALRATSVPVAVHPGTGLIHGCFDMLGVTATARDEMDPVLRSVGEALAGTSIDVSRWPTRGAAGDPGPSGQ